MIKSFQGVLKAISKNPSRRLALQITSFATVATILTGCGTLKGQTDQKSYQDNYANFGIENTIEEEQQKILSTDSYYLVRLNGNIYLTTTKIEKSETTGVPTVVISYYDVLTNALVGQIGSIDVTDVAEDVLIDQNNIEMTNKNQYQISIDTSLYNDRLVADGVYGYGKNLPLEAIIPLANFVTFDYPSKQQIEYFSSNSSDLKVYLENELFYDTVENISSYTLKIDADDLNQTGKNYEYKDFIPLIEHKPLQFITCVNKDNVDMFFGYHCSSNPGNNGHNYIYDILTGEIKDIREKQYEVINFRDYDNSIVYKKVVDLKQEIDNYVLNFDKTEKLKTAEYWVVDTSAEVTDYFSNSPDFMILKATKELLAEPKEKVYTTVPIRYWEQEMKFSTNLTTFAYSFENGVYIYFDPAYGSKLAQMSTGCRLLPLQDFLQEKNQGTNYITKEDLANIFDGLVTEAEKTR